MKKRLKKYEDSLRELQDNMKHNNIQIIGIPEEEQEQGIETRFEKIMTENFPKLETMQVQEAQRVPIKMNPKKPTPRHIIINLTSFKEKERILTAAREK